MGENRTHGSAYENQQYFDPVGRSDLFCLPAHIRDDVPWLHIPLLQLVDAEASVYLRFGLARTREEYEKNVIRASNTADTAPSITFEGGLHTIRLI